jgi:hypothetical protein
MSIANAELPVVDKEVWRAWVQKGRLAHPRPGFAGKEPELAWSLAAGPESADVAGVCPACMRCAALRPGGVPISSHTRRVLQSEKV